MGALAVVREGAVMAPASSHPLPGQPSEAPAGGSEIRALGPIFGQALQGQPDKTGDQAGESHLELVLKIPPGLNLSEQNRTEAERRYRIIEGFLKAERRDRANVLDSLVAQHGISRATLYGWVRGFNSAGLLGLVRKGRADKGEGRRVNTAALEFILATALPHPGVYGEYSAREIFRAYQEEKEWRAAHAARPLVEPQLSQYARYIDPKSGCFKTTAQLPKISCETIRLWLNRIPEPVKVYARKGPNAFGDSQEVLSYRDLAALQPLDFLVLDHRLLDVVCMTRSRTGWRLIRPWVTAAVDMRTRKWLASVIVETPSSDSIVSVLRRVFLDVGIPRACYFDNGRDYRSFWIEGRQAKSHRVKRVKDLGDAMQGILDNLGVRIYHAIIRRARSKIIEPGFISLANFERTLPWWCGHTPKSRPARFDALLEEHERWLKGEVNKPVFPTIEEVAAIFDDFLQSLNERERCGGEGMAKITPTGRGWMSPAEAWEALIGRVERRTISAELLGFCFQKRRRITVRHSEIQASFGGRMYHYRFVDSPVRLIELNGRAVELAYDPFDLGGLAAVYHEGRFLGLASCIELRKMGETAFVEDERARRAVRREVKKVISAVHQQIYVPGPIERLDRRRPVQPKRLDPPRVEVPVDIPAALVEAAQAMETQRRPVQAVEVRVLPGARADSEDGAFTFFSTEGR